MLSQTYPKMKLYYGMIASLSFSASFSTGGVGAGLLVNKMERRTLLALSCLLWSSCILVQGFSNSLVIFCIARFMHGAFAAAYNPAAYSLIAEYFPPSYRSTANAVEASGQYVGSALASMSIILIKNYGWRAMYKMVGYSGLVMAAISFFLVKEPKRDLTKIKASTENPFK